MLTFFNQCSNNIKTARVFSLVAHDAQFLASYLSTTYCIDRIHRLRLSTILKLMISIYIRYYVYSLVGQHRPTDAFVYPEKQSLEANLIQNS